MSARPITPRASAHLDLVRGLSAVAVLFGHTRGSFFVDYGSLAAPSIPLRALYFLTGYAHQAVMVFFVLSGYFVGSSVLRSWDRFSWRSYLVARLTRLYVVLIPAQLLCAAWDHAGIVHFGADSGAYGGHFNGAAVGDLLPFSQTHTLGYFAASLVFVQELLTPEFGSNGVLWSLVCEFWYYLAFPCLVASLSSRTRPATRAAGALGFVAILTFISFKRSVFIPEFALYFPIWLFGAGLAWWQEHSGHVPMPPRLLLTVGSVLAAGGLVLGRVSHALPASLIDLILGACIAAWVWGVLAQPDHPGSSLFQRYAAFAKGLAGFSFTLYAVHAPAGTFIGSWIMEGSTGRWQPDLPHLAIALSFCASLITYAWVISRFTEARTDKLRAAVTARLARWWPAT